jgi:hypothetical protein
LVPSLSVYGSTHFCPQAANGTNMNPQSNAIMSFFIFFNVFIKCSFMAASRSGKRTPVLGDAPYLSTVAAVPILNRKMDTKMSQHNK